MKIVAIDLGKFKSVACVYESDSGEHLFTTIRTVAVEVHDLLALHQPDRVVIEIGSAAGWVQDMALAMELKVQVANPNHEAWRWKSVRRKTDKDDALKLAQLSAMNQLPTLQLPPTRVRQWRSLIGYRWKLVSRRTAIKNHIRSILDRQGQSMPVGKAGWTDKTLAALPMERRQPDCPPRAKSSDKRMGVVFRNQLNGPASQSVSSDWRLETSSFTITLDKPGFI